MPKVELDAIEQVSRTGYPAPFDQPPGFSVTWLAVISVSPAAGASRRYQRPATGSSNGTG